MAAPPPDIAAILAALNNGGTPVQSSSTPQPGLPTGYPGAMSAGTPSNPLAGMSLPQPTSSGNLDLSSIKPVNSGNVSLADAIAKARGIAAEKASSRDDPRRGYVRSRSRSPQRRDNYRDNHNPFRDERRDDPRRGANGRDRSISPPMMQNSFSPRGQPTRTRSPPAKSESNSEVITVESSTVGLIIGRGGENLRRVESETGARVQFITGPEAGPKRQCRISGTPRQRADAIKDVYRVIQEHPVTAPEKSTPAPYSFQSQARSSEPPSRDGDPGAQVLVPDRTVGLVIGRGGETIRDIQERSGCHVNIVGENKSINGLRPVNLVGSRQAIDDAKRMIQEVVDSDTRSGPPASAAPQYPPVAQSQYGAPPPQYGMQYDAFGAAPAYDPSSGSGGGGGGAGNKATDTIVVPSEAVGMIIGKGGETIKEMQNTTGCKINVAPPSGPDINREIGLIGAFSAIASAKRAIWDKVNAVREKQGGVWTRGGDVAPSFGGGDQYSHQPAPYGQPTMPQQAPSSAPPPDQGDPYAAYGGYANYCALWAAAMANQPGGGGGGH